MGNVCGCVRAEKEEQCLDPAKAPLSPAKHSPGRKYFRRKSRKKSADGRPDSLPAKENEEKSQYEVGISGNIEVPPKGMELACSFPQSVTVDGNTLPTSTDLSADLVKAEVLLSETNSDSRCRDSFPGDKQRLTESAETEAWLNEQDKRSSEKSYTWKRKYSDECSTRELAFQKRASGLCYEKAASLDSAIHLLGKQHKENGLNKTYGRVVEDTLESNKSEKLHQLLSKRKSYPLLEQRRFYSSDDVFSRLPKEKAIYSIPPNRSKVSILAQLVCKLSQNKYWNAIFSVLQKCLHYAVCKLLTHAVMLQ